MEGEDCEAKPGRGVTSIGRPRDFQAWQASRRAGIEKNGETRGKRLL